MNCFDKGLFSSYMEKEIFDQPESAENTLRGRVDFKNYRVVLRGIQPHMEEIRRCRRMILIGAGSSFHVAVAVRQIIEQLTELPVMTELSSDFMDREVPVFRDDVCMFISQSGETYTTLEALRYCKSRDAFCMGITNTVLMADDCLTKQERVREIIDGLRELPGKMRQVLKLKEKLKEYGKQLHKNKSLLVMGRGYQYATCLEGAFKAKEVAYMHSEGILSGELKHGPLALIDEEMPIIMLISEDSTYDKCINALQQVTARHGQPILLCSENCDLPTKGSQVIEIPNTVDCLQPCLNIIPLQMLSVYLAQQRGHNVDKPRDLVKAVTNDS